MDKEAVKRGIEELQRLFNEERAEHDKCRAEVTRLRIALAMKGGER